VPTAARVTRALTVPRTAVRVTRAPMVARTAVPIRVATEEPTAAHELA
jgi:hypothetical protein